MKKYLAIFIALLFIVSARTAFASVILPTSVVGGEFHIDISGVHHDPTNDGIYSFRYYKGTYPDNSIGTDGTGPNDHWSNICQPLVGTDCVLNSSTPNMEGFQSPLPDGDYWYDLQVFSVPDPSSGPHGIFSVTFHGGVPSVTTTSTSTTHFNNLVLSTTTQTVRFTGYISPLDTDVHIVFNVSTPLFSQWNHGDLLATTTGVFDISFPYQNFGTSTINSFTFTGTLMTPHACFTDCDTGPQARIYDTISTTTNESGLGVTNVPTPNDTIIAVAANCNPVSSSFNVSSCVSYLFFPDPIAAGNNAARIRDTLLVKVPIGYFTRLYTILTATGTTTIPSISYTWQNDGGPLAGKTLAFNVDDYMVQAKTLTGEMTSNTDHKTAWEIFQPFINTFLAIFVLYAMINDVMGMNLIHHKR